MKITKLNSYWGIIVMLLLTTQVRAQEYDLLLKGGTVIDAKNARKGVMDVAILNDKIAEIKNNIFFFCIPTRKKNKTCSQ